MRQAPAWASDGIGLGTQSTLRHDVTAALRAPAPNLWSVRPDRFYRMEAMAEQRGRQPTNSRETLSRLRAGPVRAGASAPLVGGVWQNPTNRATKRARCVPRSEIGKCSQKFGRVSAEFRQQALAIRRFSRGGQRWRRRKQRRRSEDFAAPKAPERRLLCYTQESALRSALVPPARGLLGDAASRI